MTISGTQLYSGDREVRHYHSTKYARLCAKTTDLEVRDNDEQTWGVCQVKVSYGAPCSGDWKPWVVGGDGVGFGQVPVGAESTMPYSSCSQEQDSSMPQPSMCYDECSSKWVTELHGEEVASTPSSTTSKEEVASTTSSSGGKVVHRKLDDKDFVPRERCSAASKCDPTICQAKVGYEGQVYLCYTKTGCEGRGGPGSGKLALKKLGGNRDQGLTPPDGMPGAAKVWQSGEGVTGDLNQGMDYGGDVFLFELRAP